MSSSKSKFDLKTIEQLDADLRAGKLDPVKRKLEEIRYKKLDRPLIVRVANLARRIGYQRYAIRLLGPYVRPQKPVVPPASQEEQVEYAVNLMRLGVVGEAYKILISVDQKKNPDALLFQAFCLFNTWDYYTAIPLLEKYLRHSDVNSYQKLVAMTNLASAYTIELEFEKAELTLNKILSTADKNEQKLLVGYTHQIYAELSINRRRAAEAEEHIERAKKFLQNAHYRYGIYNSQWTAIVKMLSPKSVDEGKKLLKQVRNDALQKKLWEVLRDCDLYEATLTKNEEMVVSLYFGTPHEKFRQRILRIFKEKISLPENYIWHPNAKPSHEKYLLEVSLGLDKKSGSKLKFGQLVHKLLQILTSDFYRPFKVQTLFGLLFPDENYNLLSSPHKVYDLIARLRSWFKKNQIPLEVASTARGEFQLETLKPYAINVKPFSHLKDAIEGFFEQLKSEFKGNPFTCKDVVMLTGYSRAQAKRLLHEAVELKRLILSGKGNTTRYLIKNAAAKS
ncbi:MAG: hypothetical protein SGJ18_03895 [Pseudomonadota bacterium]|nr:hypothetical protein [Pseudomonadota bacterium]